MVNLSDQVLEKIEHDKIRPKPRREILLRRSVYWILVAILLVAGSLAASVAIFSMANTEWDMWALASGSGWQYFLIVFPYFWLIFFAGFIALAHFNLRHTRLGYRFSLVKAVVVYLGLTFFFGALFYSFGLGGKIEEKIAESAPYYHNLTGGRIVWDRPERGMLGGRIIELKEPSLFVLTDQNGMIWQVTVSGTTGANLQFIGSKIKMVGELVGTSSFRAVEIRSWCACGGCQKQTNVSCTNMTDACAVGGCACGL